MAKPDLKNLAYGGEPTIGPTPADVINYRAKKIIQKPMTLSAVELQRAYAKGKRGGKSF